MVFNRFTLNSHFNTKSSTFGYVNVGEFVVCLLPTVVYTPANRYLYSWDGCRTNRRL